MIDVERNVNWDGLLGSEEFTQQIVESREPIERHAYCSECLEYIPAGAEALVLGHKVRHIKCQAEEVIQPLPKGTRVDERGLLHSWHPEYIWGE